MDFKNLNIKTKKEALELVYNLEQCRTVEDIPKYLSEEAANLCKTILQEGKITTIEELKKDIKSYIKDIKDIDIYISFKPTKKFTEVLEDLFEPLLNKYLLNIHVDPTVMAGAIVTIDGKMYDQSLKTKIKRFNLPIPHAQ